ncbi:MAG: pyrroline-5-carboxylate reductase [Caldilineaceae bacterium]|nr:pyrroline-5-carboxylate reductase [Caldilineaceae bacterium]
MTSLHESNIAFIGSGAMGEAMIKGLLSRALIGADHLIGSDPVAARRDYIAKSYQIQTTDDNVQAVAQADIVVMSIKPQALGVVAASLQQALKPGAVVLSIMAGISLKTLQKALNHARIVRAMPNTPAQVNLGVTAWIATEAVDAEQRAQIALLLGALGEQIPVDKEEFIDMQTGLGGSGPGFVFLIIEAMIDAGVQMGFARADAQKIVLQTIAGSVALVQTTGKHPAELRNLVTSAGGTTAAGIYELEKGGIRTTLTNAILAAYQRSQELGRLSEK